MENAHRIEFAILLTGGRAKSLMVTSLLTAATLALAQAGTEIQTIWRCVDPSGKTHVTATKDETIGKDCKVIQSQRVTVMPPLPRPKKESKEELEVRRQKVAALEVAEAKAVIACRDKAACDKSFSLTQVYINKTSDQKIQIATDTIVETYNPIEDGKMGLQAMRIPDKGTSASIRLTATCKGERAAFDRCLLKKTNAYDGFRPFIASMLKE